MADARPFRALRYDPAKVDLALTIAPPYDVISADQQAALYGRSPNNIVRVEYGEERPSDDAADNRYTRAAADLTRWQREGVLIRDAEPAMYGYRLEFDWVGKRHSRHHYVVAVRLEEWEKGVVKPHEHTLSGPKADRLDLLRATRTQVSPVYCLYRPRAGTSPPPTNDGTPLYDIEADGQRHTLYAITDQSRIDGLHEYMAASDFYIADGHHRYETALAYRDECRARASRWAGAEPENFVLLAVTAASDPGLLVLATHRLLHRPVPDDALDRLAQAFELTRLTSANEPEQLLAGQLDQTAFVMFELEPRATYLVTLRDRPAVEARMPVGQSAAWKRLDVNVLQYGILQPLFGIDDTALAAGRAVSYSQDASEVRRAVDAGEATAAFLLNPTPVGQVLDVSDVNGRMPQKSTYFYPKLPTGLVLNALD